MIEQRPSWVFKASNTKSDTFAGGVPYLREDEKWPLSEDGTPWSFLFQVSLKDVDDIGLNLPKEGYLQFFIYPDSLFGVTFEDYEDPTKGNKTFVRHVVDAIDRSDIKIPKLETEDFDSPLESSQERVYYSGEKFMMKPFAGSIEAPLSENEDDDNEDLYDDLNQEEYEFYLGGYAGFTQDDFRSEHNDYVVLLGSVSGENIMWGDMGIASYWITDEDLDNQNYERVFLYWDCY